MKHREQIHLTQITLTPYLKCCAQKVNKKTKGQPKKDFSSIKTLKMCKTIFESTFVALFATASTNSSHLLWRTL